MKTREGFEENENILIQMSRVKIGEFVSMTPSLQEIERRYPRALITVPDTLWKLYYENRVFHRAIPARVGDSILPDHILDVSHPLFMQPQRDHHGLNRAYFEQELPECRRFAQALNDYFPGLSLQETKKAFLRQSLEESAYQNPELHSICYFTTHLGAKDYEQKDSFEESIAYILDQTDDLFCFNFVGPSSPQLFLGKNHCERFFNIKTDLRHLAYLMADSLFHLDSGSGIHRIAEALDLPSIILRQQQQPRLLSNNETVFEKLIHTTVNSFADMKSAL